MYASLPTIPTREVIIIWHIKGFSPRDKAIFQSGPGMAAIRLSNWGTKLRAIIDFYEVDVGYILEVLRAASMALLFLIANHLSNDIYARK